MKYFRLCMFLNAYFLIQANSGLVKMLIEKGSLVSTELDSNHKNILHVMAEQCMANQHTAMLKLFGVSTLTFIGARIHL